MYKPYLILLLLFVGSFLSPASENHSVGARSISLSHAFISISDSWSTFHNQATLANFNTISAGIFYESRYLVDEFSLAAATLVIPYHSGTFGFSFYQFGKYTFKESKIGLSYSKKLGQRLNAGVQMDYYTSRFPENDGMFGYTTFECGVSYQAAENIYLGAHVLNPVRNGFSFPEGKQKLPAIIRLGGHYTFFDNALLSVETQKNSHSNWLFKTGVEFTPVEKLAFRFGISGRPVKYTAGIGYGFGKITCNIAFSYHGNLGFTPSVSIQYNL